MSDEVRERCATAFELAEEFLNAYDENGETWEEALSGLSAKYGVKPGESILAKMFEYYKNQAGSQAGQSRCPQCDHLTKHPKSPLGESVECGFYSCKCVHPFHVEAGHSPQPEVEVFADHAEPCMQKIGLTTCGYPRADAIHNKRHIAYHEFVPATDRAGSPSPQPQPCENCQVLEEALRDETAQAGEDQAVLKKRVGELEEALRNIQELSTLKVGGPSPIEALNRIGGIADKSLLADQTKKGGERR